MGPDMSMGPKKFAVLVSREASGHASPEEQEFLRRPENLGRWLETLNIQARSIQDQLTSRGQEVERLSLELIGREWEDYDRRYKLWRRSAGIALYQTALRLKEVRALKKSHMRAQNFPNKRDLWVAIDMAARLVPEDEVEFHEYIREIGYKERVQDGVPG